MGNSSILLSFLAVISSFLCIYGKYHEKLNWVYLFKPLTTLLIIFIAILSGTSSPTYYSYWIYIGLSFCLLGDIFLMLPNKFIWGLISFLVAHLLFLIFFITLTSSITIFLIIIFIVFGSFIYSLLFKYLGKMKIPVLIYLTIIFLMSWRGIEYFITYRNFPSILISISVLLFMFSDSNIAFNKFRKPYKSAEFLILTTYYLSIYLIAISLSFI